MTWQDGLALWGHFALLSLLAFGGATAVAPDMHRYLVQERHWLSTNDFSSAFTLAQVAPGPNVLFVTLIGWQAGGWLGALATTTGMLLPSSVLALLALRLGTHWEAHPFCKAFRSGLAPLTIGLTLATGWLLARATVHEAGTALIAGVTVLLVTRTKIAPLWLIGIAAVLGGLGWL